VVEELAQGVDTLAGLARQYDLPVQAILEWRNQLQRVNGRSGAANGTDLLMGGLGAGQSRLSGPC
jgi:transposase-like protein